jgi:cytochrome b6-f complex subunit 4
MQGKGEGRKEKSQKRFYPDYLLEILFMVFIVIEAVLILALLYPPAIGREIDFTAGFQPKPEWYFLWLYQLVRYFPGGSAFIGTILIPLFSIALLILIPYIDRGRHGRILSIIAGMLLFLTFLILTIIPAFDL